jgi:hypothetical protein
MNLVLNCLHRSFAGFRASLRSMPTLETIEEEDSGIEEIDEPEIWDTIEYDEKDWVHWQEAREEWGQWTDIETMN